MLKNVSKIASELSKAESIPHTRQVLRQWKDAGTLGSNLVSLLLQCSWDICWQLIYQSRTLRNEFGKQPTSPTPHTDVPAFSELKILEPKADDTELSVQDIKSFLGPVSVWDKHYSQAAHTWIPTENTFGENYGRSVKNLDPIPLQSFLRKVEKGWIERQSQASQGDQKSGTGAATSKEPSPTDQDLDVLAEQLVRQISTCLDNEEEVSRI